MANNAIPDIVIDDEHYKSCQKLAGKVAIITGGDSGIGAAVAIAYAKEGARVIINYLQEDQDALAVSDIIKRYGGECTPMKGDISEKAVCGELVAQTLEIYGGIDIVINNAGTQTQRHTIRSIGEKQLTRTFRTNIFSMFYLVQAALPHLKSEACIINTTSVTAYRGSKELIDYSATKGAIVSFTRSLSQSLADISIRVNAVAPGPVWTPLVLTSFSPEKLASFGKDQPLGYAAQPVELAPAYVFLASSDARYITGQVLHVNGGEIING